MDPSILKSLQKIEELVKTKKNIIEQIPAKPISEPANPILPPHPQFLVHLKQQSLIVPPNHPEPALFMGQMPVQPQPMNPLNPALGLMGFGDGIMVQPQPQPEPLAFFAEPEKSRDKGKGGSQAENPKKKTQQEMEQSAKDKKKKLRKLRKIAVYPGETWEDKTLEDWPDNDFRIFCGDLGNEVNDEVLATSFRKYSSFQRARVIRDKRSGKTKGYGFVSLMDPQEYLRALSEMNGKYIGNRPIKIRKSTWKDRGLVGGKFSDAKGRKKLKIN